MIACTKSTGSMLLANTCLVFAMIPRVACELRDKGAKVVILSPYLPGRYRYGPAPSIPFISGTLRETA